MYVCVYIYIYIYTYIKIRIIFLVEHLRTATFEKRTKYGYYWMFPLFYFWEEKPLDLTYGLNNLCTSS